MSRTILLAFAAVVLFGGQGVAASIVFECDFPRFSDEKGTHKPSKKFAMKFAYDSVTGEAVMIGNLGVQKIVSSARNGGDDFRRESWHRRVSIDYH